MAESMQRLLLVGMIVCCAELLCAAEPVRKDAFGGPLPSGAVARLGTERFRLDENRRALDLSPDGQSYVDGISEGLSLRSVATGQQLQHWPRGSTEYRRRDLRNSIRFSPDGKLLVGYLEHNLQAVEVASGKALNTLPVPLSGDFSHLSFSGDSKRLAISASSFGRETSITVVDLTTWKSIYSTKLPEVESCAVALSHDGKLAAIWGSSRGRDFRPAPFLRVVDLDASVDLKLATTPGRAASMVFSPAGTHFAVLTESGVVIADFKANKIFNEFLVPTSRDPLLTYSPDGKRLLVADAGGVIGIWDTTTWERRICRGPTILPASIRFLPDGKILALGGEGSSVCIWEVLTGNMLSPPGVHTHPIHSLAFSLDGRSLLSIAEDGARSWDLTGLAATEPTLGANCQNYFVLPHEDYHRFGPGVPPVALPGGKLLRMLEGGIALIDVATRETEQVLHGYRSSPLILTADGRTLVTQGWERDEVARSPRILLWDVSTGRKMQSFSLPVAETCEVAVSANRRVLAVVANRPKREDRFSRYRHDVKRRTKIVPAVGEWKEQATELVLWDIVTGKEIGRHAFEQIEISALALSPDGRLLAFAASDPGIVGLWDVELNALHEPLSGKLEQKFEGERSKGEKRIVGQTYPLAIERLQFSPDGRLILAVSQEHPGRVTVWEAASGTIRHSYETAAATQAFSSDSQLLATASANSILLWDLSGRLARPGPPRQKLTVEQLQTLWTDLSAASGASAFLAMTTLIHAPETAVILFRERVNPVEGKAPDAKEIDRLIRALDDEDFSVRERASEALAAMARVGRPAVLGALADRPAPEKKRRLEDLVRGFKSGFAPPQVMRSLRAVEMLEQLNTPSSRDLLKSLASGRPGDTLTTAAQEALQRLNP
jgi:WD40 repeat protein